MQVEGFDIIRQLGLGATSEVHEARRQSDDKIVALKIFSSICLTDPESLSRLRLEAEALGQIQHPNIVRLIGQIHRPNLYALELELVRGQDLREWAKQYKLGLLEPPLWILAQVARGLGAAHELGILHRDLKPENILVSFDGKVKVTDFGLARSISRLTMTRMGLLVGSMGYMAPEVIDGQRATPLSDVFSFGVLAYELLAGKAPFVGETPQSLVRSISDGHFQPLSNQVPHLTPEISELIDLCLSKDPKRRPESIWLVEGALMTALAKSQILLPARSLITSHYDSTLAAETLKKKFEILKQELEVAQKEIADHPGPRSRLGLLRVARELHALFPDDSSALGALQALAVRPRSGRTAVWSGIGILFLLSVTAAFYLYDTPRSKGVPAQLVTPVPPLAVTVPPAMSATSESLKPSPIVQNAEPVPHPAHPARKPVPKGRVHFEVDDDVTVFLDDVEVPADLLDRFPATVGRHIVKLVKQGFLPIENKIFVRNGQETLVRAGRGGTP